MLYEYAALQTKNDTQMNISIRMIALPEELDFSNNMGESSVGQNGET